ncbi:class A beta-lactamase, subclass A2 [Olivibacter sp. 47]|uniref:class A beta-lactamase, subclass A2 n=1 Tax=Olivibacter sp. 47 TaxID=3056486 RepID=UPI0025A4AD3E|nr:class A beta-lactamase, subclass A2 [Olivibacter sp. 47]MDM8173667.1 class A beta-lactamase, subclass A2 [Olivibacter sp. 47]
MKYSLPTRLLISALFIFISFHALAQPPKEVLRSQIKGIIATGNAEVGVSILGIEDNDTLSVNGYKHYPMISVFKFQIALTVLNKVDKGELSLNQKIFIKKDELLKETWSPFRKKYPEGNVYITLKESLQWMVSHSDNNICDILIRLVGGVHAIDTFIASPNFVIKNNEEEMHRNWDAQYVNTITPNFSTQQLKQFYEGRILTKSSTEFLYKTMVETVVGPNRIKGKLPANAEVAHRPGSSFTNEQGLTAAVNDVGIIQLPNGKHFAIAVFVYNTTEKYKTAEDMIASIAKATWDYYTAK